MPFKHDWRGLPRHLREDPDTVDWLLTNHEERIRTLESHEPQKHGISLDIHTDKLPWGQIITAGILGLGGLIGQLRGFFAG